MKVSYIKRLANYYGSSSCLDEPRGHREALSGGDIGMVLSSDIFDSGSRPSSVRGNATERTPYNGKVDALPAESETHRMYQNSMRENRDTQQASLLNEKCKGWSR